MLTQVGYNRVGIGFGPNSINMVEVIVNSDACLHIKTIDKSDDHYVHSPYPRNPSANDVVFGVKLPVINDAEDSVTRVFYQINSSGHILKIDSTLDEDSRPLKKGPYCFKITIPVGINLYFHIV